MHEKSPKKNKEVLRLTTDVEQGYEKTEKKIWFSVCYRAETTNEPNAKLSFELSKVTSPLLVLD